MKQFTRAIGRLLCFLGLHQWKYIWNNRDQLGYRECRRCKRFQSTRKRPPQP
ncbi:MAG TPA: hypothetical protein V6D19_08110 [Stenomitos sp.]